MELRDLLVTPIIILLIYAGAYVIRPHVTDQINRGYFFPALTVRILGAIALGFIYQFYYSGGDTFNYHTNGSRVVWEAFTDSPDIGLKLLLNDGSNSTGIYEYSSRIYFYRDHSSYFVIRIAALFDLLTFSSYSATAVLFGAGSFAAMWMLYLTFYKEFPRFHRGIAVATLFIPSVFFWGSGVLKDTVIISCLGVATYHFHLLFIERKGSFWSVVALLISLYVIFSVKIFILQVYLPAIIVWIVAYNFGRIRSTVLKMLLVPLVVTLVLVSSIYSIVKIGEDDAKYSVGNLAKTARITAYDIRYWTGRDAGSGYTLDIEDWTPAGMILAAPAAINVSLFRPYLWEVRNPLMLVSAIESSFLLIFTLYIIVRNFRQIFLGLTNYNVLFCLAFSISFAFAVGISTFNFGTLTRYKIPLLPFYMLALVILMNYSNSDRNVEELEETE
ncbi:MAG: hypothetical protein HOP08_06735 [Cyclobacteriaceae bacterium]|nr:hypothetical protein [Cyclobacteriaceae bacterium]